MKVQSQLPFPEFGNEQSHECAEPAPLEFGNVSIPQPEDKQPHP